MVKEWTKKERKEQLAEKYRSLRSKVFVIASMAVIFILLLWGIFYTIKAGMPDLLLMLVILLVVFVPLAIFFIDQYWFEFQ